MRMYGRSVVVATVLLVGSAGVALAQAESPVPSAATEAMTPEAAELAALFPEQVGGQPVRESLEFRVGDEHVADLDANDPDDVRDIQSMEALAQAMGGTVADLVSASVYIATDDGGFALVGAYRVVGGDATLAVDPVLATAQEDLAEARSEAGSFADREVTLLYDDSRPDDPPWYLYPSGDTLWLVIASEPLLTEVFEQLP